MAREGLGRGSIYPEEGRGWAVSVSLGKDENGRRIRKRIRGKTRAEVEAKLADLLELRSLWAASGSCLEALEPKGQAIAIRAVFDAGREDQLGPVKPLERLEHRAVRLGHQALRDV